MCVVLVALARDGQRRALRERVLQRKERGRAVEPFSERTTQFVRLFKRLKAKWGVRVQRRLNSLEKGIP